MTVLYLHIYLAVNKSPSSSLETMLNIADDVNRPDATMMHQIYKFLARYDGRLSWFLSLIVYGHRVRDPYLSKNLSTGPWIATSAIVALMIAIVTKRMD